MRAPLVFSPSILSSFFETADLSPFFAELRKTDNCFDEETHERFCFYLDEICTKEDSSPFYPYMSQQTKNMIFFGMPTHHKDDLRSRWTRFCKTGYTFYMFTGNLLECFIEHLFIHSNWRYNVRVLSQIPSSIYQAIKKHCSPSVPFTKIFPLLSAEREAIRNRLYPRILNDVVCVLRILHYDGKADEKQEEEQVCYKRKRDQQEKEDNDEDDDDNSSDLSLLEDQRVEANGNLSLLSKDKLYPKMHHSQWPALLECEYSCYTLSATLFSLAVSFSSSSSGKEELSPLIRYLRMRHCLADKDSLALLEDEREKEAVTYLLKILSRNPAVFLRLENQTLVLEIRAMLEFFKNARFLLSKQVGSDEYRILSHRTGQLIPFLSNDGEKMPEEVICRVKEPRQFLLFRLADPLSLNTSLLILKNRFLDAKTDHTTLYAIYFSSNDVYLCINEKFYRDIQQVYVPYLCTTNNFLKRPGTFGMLYPIHVQNFYSSSTKTMLIAVKSLLRLFFVFRGPRTRHVIPRPEEPVADFLRLLAPILELFTPHEIIQHLDEPFLVPSRLCFSKQKLAIGINEEEFTLYSALRSFCFVNMRHEIVASSISKLALFFQSNQKVAEKWKHVAHLVSHLSRISLASDDRMVEIPDRLFPHHVFPFPTHLLLYLFIATEPLLPRDIGVTVFLTMRPIFSRKRTLGKLSFPATQPGLVDIRHEALENKYRDLFQDLGYDPFEKDTTTTKPHNLILLFEYLEQCSFFSTQVSYDEYTTLRKQKVKHPLEIQTQFKRFLPLDYDWILSKVGSTSSSPHLTETLPLYFNESKPVISKQVFPVWMSELNHPVFFTRKKSGDALGNASELRPFTGAHKDLLNCMILFPCSETIQLFS